MSLPSNIAAITGVLTLGAGLTPAAIGQLDKDGGVAKALGGAAETIGKTSTSVLEKVGLNMGSDVKNAALLGTIAAAVLGGIAYFTRDKGEEPEVPMLSQIPLGPTNGGNGRNS